MSDGISKLWVFHGCDHKVGSTILAHETAKMISKQKKNLKVLFTSINGHDYGKYCRDNNSSIENIKIKTDNNLLTVEDVKNECCKDEELYVLGGVKGVFAHRNYSPVFPEILFKRAAEFFDVIIADCGNDVDSGLCVGTLNLSIHRIMVITQNESSLIRLNELSQIYETLNFHFPYYIINRYSEEDPHDIKYIAGKVRVSNENVFTVRDESNYSRVAEMDEMLISSYKCSAYTKDIKKISDIIIKNLGFEEPAELPKKRRLFSFM